jgi:hypothetical protein
MPMITQRPDGKLEFDFSGRTIIVDPNPSVETITVLVQMIKTLDQRLTNIKG